MHVAFKYNHIPSPRRLQMPVLHLHCAGLPSLRRSYVQAVAANRDTPLPKLLQLQLLSRAKAPYARCSGLPGSWTRQPSHQGKARRKLLGMCSGAFQVLLPLHHHTQVYGHRALKPQANSPCCSP